MVFMIIKNSGLNKNNYMNLQNLKQHKCPVCGEKLINTDLYIACMCGYTLQDREEYERIMTS